MKLSVGGAAVLAAFAIGALGGSLVSGYYADQRCGSQLLAQINSDSARQIAHYEKIKEILATGDSARLFLYLDNQIEMAKLALRSSAVAMQK